MTEKRSPYFQLAADLVTAQAKAAQTEPSAQAKEVYVPVTNGSAWTTPTIHRAQRIYIEPIVGFPDGTPPFDHCRIVFTNERGDTAIVAMFGDYKCLAGVLTEAFETWNKERHNE